ncbi:hypothetical protein MKW94_009702 [Papaver nudicaule]|uniref:Exonuclease domain-containing protein n=1 Tax=Papaver nudicaule TaxID=74823 RepID=A0AA41VYC9_PAPNU|nr:hypothetical protein [Papaver nudicaule]
MFKKRLATARKEILVNMVKMVQQRQMKGAKGNWHEFLNFYDPKFGASLSDPKRRSADLLVSFLETFTEGEDVKFLKKVLQRQLNREDILQLNTNANLESSIQKLIRLTFEHPEYASSYSFPSYDKDWVVTRISKSKTKESNKMVAVDCEMVRCEDQTDAVVKVCVVDQNLGVKLDKVVNPGKPISDYRSKITGITAKDLEGVTCTLADVQKSMKKLLSDGTILIGHSLHCDLEALKLDHARVIDTSLIFKCTDGTYFKRPSLNHLCKVVLNREVREEGAEHNCLDDACAAMKVVLAKLKTGFDEVIFLDQKDKLFLHRIPVCVSEEELRKLFSADSAVVLKPKYKEKAKLYSAIATFKDQHEALETFQSIEGEERKDSSGFRQKLISVQLKNASCAHIYVRKMVRDDRTALDSSSRKRRIQEVVEPSNEGSKYKLKKNSDDCLEHEKVIQMLENELRVKDSQLRTLQQAISLVSR